jgi:nucleoside-diphosphate-sugar epimerase
MRILIVGCGYIGTALGAEFSLAGHEVFGLRRSATVSPGITPIIGDITQPATLATLPRDFDWVVNCVSSSHGGADAYRQTYLEGTRNLLAHFADAPPKKFAYTSSTGVYGQDDGSLVKESSSTEPATDTGKILVETEKLLLAAVVEKKFPAVILRVAGIYGPERGHWFKQFLKGEAQMEGDGSRPLNMIHRDDVVGGVIAALKSGRAGEVYNACDDEPVTQLNFFRWLAESLGKPMPPSVPADAVETRKRGVTNKKISNRKLKMELGYQFKYPNFRKGYTAEMQRLMDAGVI